MTGGQRVQSGTELRGGLMTQLWLARRTIDETSQLRHVPRARSDEDASSLRNELEFDQVLQAELGEQRLDLLKKDRLELGPGARS